MRRGAAQPPLPVPYSLFCVPFLLLFLYSLILQPSAHAQTTPQSIAQTADQHYNRLHSLSVHFTQQYDGLGQHRQESGTLLLKKPGRMKWTYTQPPGKLFLLDGKDAYFYTPGQTEVQRLPAKQLDDLRSPLRFLLGHAELAKELLNPQLTPNGPNYDLTGAPKNLANRVASLRFTITPTGAIQAIRIEELDGSISLFTFSGEQPNPPATDTDFQWKPLPGTAVVTGLPPS